MTWKNIYPVTGAQLNSPTFRLRLSQGLGFKNTDIDTLLFNVRYNIQAPSPVPPTPTPSPTKVPLILIPGIGGSELKVADETSWSADNGHSGTFTHTYSKDEKVWVNEIEAIKPGNDDYFDILRMKPDGITSEADLSITGNLFDGAYGTTLKFFTDNGYTLDTDLFVFPYDWRKDISNTASLLDQKIEDIKQQTNSDKVDIITHSMGGLVARNYIADTTRAQKVRKLLTLGPPNLGAVKLLKALQYGDHFGPSFLFGVIALNPDEARDVIQNFIGSFELMPTSKYFDFYSNEDNLHPSPFRDERDVDGNGVTGVLNYEETKNLLINLGRNSILFNPTEALHSLDSNLSNTNGVEVANIVGSGQPTLGQIIEKYSFDAFGIKIPSTDEVSINGDGTVPLFSASLNDPTRGMSLLGDAKVYYTKQDHGSLVSPGPALNLVKNILEDSDQIPAGISSAPYSFNGTSFSVHSPVNIHVYDANGNHTGPTGGGDIEESIPGSSYNTLDDAKFIYVPGDGVYTVHFEALDTGSFDFKIRTFEDSINTETLLYKDIPLTTGTEAETSFDTSSNQSSAIDVDENGDGTVDFSVDRLSIVEGEENFDYTSPVLSVDVAPKNIWPPNNKMIDVSITGMITDDNPYLTRIVVDDEYDLIEPSITTYGQDVNQTMQLEASRRKDDMDGRIYTIRVFAIDIAGNIALSTFYVTVPHDQRDKR